MRTHLDGDSTCFYLLESVKEGARTHFEGAQLGVMYEKILEVRGDIAIAHKRIARKLISAAKSTSRMTRNFKQQINAVKMLGD
ncbi:hypothetical protein MCEORH2_01004 [Methylophilaceae bacterium]